MAFVPCTKWIKRGVVTGRPVTVSLTRDELNEIVSSASGNWHVERDKDYLDSSGEEEGDRYNMESYDDPEANTSNPLGIGSLAVYSCNPFDEYVNVPGMDDYDTDDEDDIIKPTDNLIVVGRSSRENSGNDLLEVHIYNENDGDRYVHHDIALASCPLSIECVCKGTFIAIGELKPFIEIHSINIINPVEATARLGSIKEIAESKCHQSAVLDLSWNSDYTHILASGSADKSVILWDIGVLKSAVMYSDYKGRVENVNWDPEDSHSLLTGCSDRHIRILDGRKNTVASEWIVSGEVLACEWCENNSQNFMIGTSSGKIYKFDKRKRTPIWEFVAHNSDITGLACLPDYPGLVASTSVSGSVKVWDVGSSPENVYSHNFDTKELHCLSINPDEGSVACFGGANYKKEFLELADFSILSETIKDWNLYH